MIATDRGLTSASSPPRRAARFSDALIVRSLADIGASAFTEGPKRLIARDRRDELVQVPFARRLRRLLEAHQVHVVHHAAILAQLAAVGEEVVDRRLAHLGE